MAILTLQEVRDEGYLDPPYADGRVTTAIARVQRYIEKHTSNWFEPREMTILMDGSGTPTLMLSHPIVSITEIQLDEVVVDSDDYAIFNRHLVGLEKPDDRKNPKIVFKSANETGGAVWTRGVQNVSIEGKFGFTEYDSGNVEGQTPIELKAIALRLIVRFLELAGEPYSEEAWRAHQIREDKSRGNYVRYGGAFVEGMIWAGLTGDINIDRMLARYMAPVQADLV